MQIFVAPLHFHNHVCGDALVEQNAGRLIS